MKKILIGILIILLFVMAYFAIFRGISIGSFQILSVPQIQEENDKLTQSIAETETLMHSTYATQTEKLNESVTDLLTAKEEYYDLTDVSTEGQIKQANKQETYKIEYLWARIGSHATAQGVTLKFDVTSGDTGESNIKNLSFTISGNYIAIINFVSAIEDDSHLGFRIENFKILPGSSSDSRQATFTVRNVRIKQETTTGSTTSTKADNTENNTENNNTENNTAEGDNTNTAQ